MTGKGHRWTGVGSALFGAALARIFGLPEILTAAVAAATTTAPDWLEVPFYRNGARAGQLIAHRTLTHWPVLWAAVTAFGVHEGGLPGAVMVGFAMGAFTHILGDAPNPMGIPWLLPHRRVRLGKKGWWRSGEKEIIMSLTYATLGYIAWALSGGRIS